MIRNVRLDDKDIILSMMTSFYGSEAVIHPVSTQHFETTFAAAMDGSPFLRLLLLETKTGNPTGYALLNFTRSNEAGGLVVILEELYLKEVHRCAGYGSALLRFLEHEYPVAARFRLEVCKENQKAIALYQRLGYEFLDYQQMVKETEKKNKNQEEENTV